MQSRQSDLEAVPLPNSRLRLAAAILGLISLGLLLSLLPRTSFVSRPAGDIVDAVGPVWPEQSVEQVLDDGLGAVSEIRIWGAAGVGRGEAPVVAALLQGPDRELVRQDRVGIKPSHLLQPYVLEFPPYHPTSGEALILQLWVTDERRNHAIFGTTEAGEEGGGPTLNLNATEQGPLAYDVIWRGDGWRAALEGSWLDRLRLAGGIAAAVLAVLLQPSVLRRLRSALGRAQIAVLGGDRQIALRPRLARLWPGTQASPADPDSRRRAIYLFPWLIPAFAILHFLATNLLLVRAYEAIVIGMVVMAGATVIFVGMRVILKSAAAAAVFTSLVSIAFFSYGHVYADRVPPDDRYVFGIGVPIVLGIALLLRGRSILTPAILRFLNLGSLLLVALPIGQILIFVVGASLLSNRHDDPITAFPGLDERIIDTKTSVDSADFPDIYYIILDQYPRSGSPKSFDNSAFIQELEGRGFYVDPNARSNYPRTQWSIAASLNMNYPEVYNEDQIAAYELFQYGNEHALGHIVKALGYKYVHVSSGWYFTNTSSIADLVVSFGTSGHMLSDPTADDPCALERMLNLSNEFAVGFLQTTMADRFLRLNLEWEAASCTHYWRQPSFALEWIAFMKSAGKIGGPKFVFAHLIKPHEPYSFDRFGNISWDREGWSNDHDPTVESAFYGQLLWLNGQLLEMIDELLAEYKEPPIIVIAGDHGSRDGGFGDPAATEILAAYLLPDGGETAIYRHITSVNTFRSILNYYFGLGFDMLEDKVYSVYE